VVSIVNRDYTMVLGVTIFYSAFLIAINMLVDILYGVVDPRVEAG
jgi:ABC-type dipeptide/oligopeptide/nickel transport system permease component